MELPSWHCMWVDLLAGLWWWGHWQGHSATAKIYTLSQWTPLLFFVSSSHRWFILSDLQMSTMRQARQMRTSCKKLWNPGDTGCLPWFSSPLKKLEVEGILLSVALHPEGRTMSSKRNQVSYPSKCGFFQLFSSKGLLPPHPQCSYLCIFGRSIHVRGTTADTRVPPILPSYWY
jgi:hypothetical protein